MCRHLAYLGEPTTIGAVIFDPPHSLAQQAWMPRHQVHGTMNVDGFGFGWYADGDPIPARYRRATPIWSDESAADLARVTSTRVMLCAVRSASVGTGADASAAAPYAAGHWLFSLNGALLGWPTAAGTTHEGRRRPSEPPANPDDAAAVLRVAATLSPRDLLGLQARCDTALLWALVLRRLQAGQDAVGALTGTIREIHAAGARGRFNFLLTDGTAITATAAGDSLYYRHQRQAVVVASEPFDDDHDWLEVPDDSVLHATRAEVTIEPLTGKAPH